MSQSSLCTHPLQLVLGPTLWSIWFVAVYGGLSVACSFMPPPLVSGPVNWVNAALLAITVTVVGILIYLAWCCWQSRTSSSTSSTRFITRVAAGLHLMSAGATVAVGFPLVGLPPCV